MLSVMLLSLIKGTVYSYAQVTDSLFRVREKRIHELVLAKSYTAASFLAKDVVDDERVSSEVLLDCIECSIQTKQYKEALSLCDKWVKSFPYKVDTQVNYYYGLAYYNLYDYKNAKAYLERIVRKKDIDDSVILLYANTLYNDLKYKDATTYYERYLNNNKSALSDKDLGEVYLLYAISTLTQGKEQEGLSLLQKSAALGDDSAKELVYRLSNSPSFAKEVELKQSTLSSIKKDIRSLDIPELKQDMQGKNANAFWLYVADNSHEHQKVVKAMNSRQKPKAFQYAYHILNETRPAQEAALKEYNPLFQSEIEKNYERILFDNTYTCNIRFYQSDDVHAFSTPYGQIYIATGLIKRFQYAEPLLLAVCAHEATHYKCEHSLMELWMAAEKNRKAELWGNLAAGMFTLSMVGANAVLEVNSGVNGIDYRDVGTIARSIQDAIFEDAYYFKYRYSRSQELEADIMAYRFCEQMGIGGYSFILALELLGDNDMYMKAEKTSTHPTTAYRIALLKYLWKTEHPDIE